jgi:diacylglycerol kinase family enzyme
MRVVLVHNPKSGDDDHSSEQIARLIRDAGHDVSSCCSNTDWRQKLDGSVELVAIAGGDGTVGNVARAIAGDKVPITILPTGTANNIATWLGLSGRPPAELIAGWTSAVRRPFDLGLAHGPWGEFRFLESVGIGLLAEMMAAIDVGEAGWVNDLSRREMRINAALEVLGRVLEGSSGMRCNLELDGQQMGGEYLLVEFLNFGAAGPNLALAPAADCGDGLLDVVLVEAHQRELLEAHLTAVRAGSNDVPELPICHARHVAIEFAPNRLHLDDELWTSDAGPARVHAAITLQPGALEFLVPSRRICEA